MHKERLDVILTERGLVESRSLAQRLIMAGEVRGEGQLVMKPSIRVNENAKIEIEQGPKFVSRGGEKIEAAILAFGLTDLSGQVCVDVGASTGGFTDCLLQYGARRVYSVDVGYGVLHWKLRNHPAVVSMERTNARHIETFPEPIDLVTIDASFISLKILLPAVKRWFGERDGRAVVLVKPQFEAGKKDAAKGEGVIRDSAIHRQVLMNVLESAQAEGFEVQGLIQSPLHGPKGNIEFLANLAYPLKQDADLLAMVAEVLPLSEEE